MYTYEYYSRKKQSVRIPEELRFLALLIICEWYVQIDTDIF